MIEINNLTKIVVDKKFLDRVAKIVLKGENKEKTDLSIAFIGLNAIKKLNKRYRKKNQPTDVLTFSQVSSFKFQVSSSELGEIIICPQVVKRNAKKFKSSFKKELTLVLIHGILHLLGYDHKKTEKEAKKMRKKEEYYLSKIIKK